MLDVNEPTLPRKRKKSRRKRDVRNTSNDFFHETLENFANQTYYEALNLLTYGIKNRFEQQDYKRYVILENLIVKCGRNECYIEELEIVVSSYEEFEKEVLSQQLEYFSNICGQVKNKDFPSLLAIVKKGVHLRKLIFRK